jgi:hypothetical protein
MSKLNRPDAPGANAACVAHAEGRASTALRARRNLPSQADAPRARNAKWKRGRSKSESHDTAAFLRSLASDPRPSAPRKSWKRILQEILWTHNDRHARKPKAVSFKTQAERANALFRCFRDLHALGYKVKNPYCLRGEHIEALIRDWTAARPQNRTHTLSPAMIQVELSHLRTFSEWIGKPGLVRPAESYVEDPALVRRHYATRQDRGWTGNGVDADALVQRIAAYDPWVGAQLRLARAFGLRVKEAVMFQPHLAERAAEPRDGEDAAADPAIEVARGTKGGRLRRVPIDTAAKRAALEAAKALVQASEGNLAHPGRDLKQNLKRLHNVLTKFAVTRRALGITAHGLRHEYVGDGYQARSGVAPPVRGGRVIDRDTDRRVRLALAQELGHSRVQIVAAYIGSRRTRTKRP